MTALLALSALIALARLAPLAREAMRDRRARRPFERIHLPHITEEGEPLPNGLRVAISLQGIHWDFRSSFESFRADRRARAFERIEPLWLDAMLDPDRPPIPLRQLDAMDYHDRDVARTLLSEHYAALSNSQMDDPVPMRGATLFMDARLSQGLAMRAMSLIGAAVPIEGYAVQTARGLRVARLGSVGCGCGRYTGTISVWVEPGHWTVRQSHEASSHAASPDEGRRRLHRTPVVARVPREGADEGVSALRAVLRRAYCARPPRAVAAPNVRVRAPESTTLDGAHTAARAALAEFERSMPPALEVFTPDEAPFGDGLRIHELVRDVSREGCADRR